MKKRGFLALTLIFFLLAISIVSAETTSCDLEVSLINQDPYPAIPGDYVDLVFQVDGIANSDCGDISFELKENFPISFDPLDEAKIETSAGFYERNYGSFLIVPYKVRVSEDALDGDNPIEVEYTSSNTYATQLKEFNLNIQDVRVDFEIFVKDYNPTTKIMTLEILNTGESDIEALTIEIPRQDHIDLKGPKRNIIGDLDSNDYTTAEFEAISDGGNIELEITYTDSINERRTLTKTITFTPEYFEGRNGEKKTSPWVYVIVIIVIVGLIWWWIRKRKYRLTHRRH